MRGLNLKAMIKAAKRTDLVISPKLQQWLVIHGDDPLSPEVADRIRDLLATPPRDRTQSFSASSAGQCLRLQVLGYLGFPGAAVDHQLANIFNDGKWRHLRWQAMLLMAEILTDIYDIEDPQMWPAMRARGTMDGTGVVADDHPRAEWRGEEYTFELKGVSTYLYPRYKDAGPKEEDHLQQVGRYLLMTGYNLADIIYEDKSTQDWTEWVVERDGRMDRIIARQLQELQDLNGYVNLKQVPPCNCERGKESMLCEMYKGVVWPEGDRWVANN